MTGREQTAQRDGSGMAGVTPTPVKDHPFSEIRNDLGVLKTKEGFAGGWVWTLPVEAAA